MKPVPDSSHMQSDKNKFPQIINNLLPLCLLAPCYVKNIFCEKHFFFFGRPGVKNYSCYSKLQYDIDLDNKLSKFRINCGKLNTLVSDVKEIKNIIHTLDSLPYSIQIFIAFNDYRLTQTEIIPWTNKHVIKITLPTVEVMKASYQHNYVWLFHSKQ